MDERSIPPIIKHGVAGVTVAFIFGSMFIFDTTLRDFHREARIRDKELAFLKQEGKKHDEELLFLERKNKELNEKLDLLIKRHEEELSHINQKNRDLQNKFVSTSEYYFGECSWSGFVNDYDEAFVYAPDGYVITGVTSEHDNGPEDRRFMFKVCKLLRR